MSAANELVTAPWALVMTTEYLPALLVAVLARAYVLLVAPASAVLVLKNH